MNPLTNVRNIQNLNKRELELSVPFAQSWHQQYRESAWIFIGGLDYDLTEGDIICLFSQYGEVVNINLIRDQKTGKSKGFAFLCYENQLSTVLSVDNLNSIKLCGRTIRVDHVEEYKVPKMKEDMAPEKIKLALEGCAPQLQPPPQTRGAGDNDTTASSVRREEDRRHGNKRDNGRPSKSSGPTSDVKTEPSQPADVELPPRLFDLGVKTETGISAKKKSKDKKNKKSKKMKKKSKSKKSKKSKESGSSSSNSDDSSESDFEKESVRDRTFKQKKVVGGSGRVGEGSGGPAGHKQRYDHFPADRRNTVRVKEEPRERGYSSMREGGFCDRSSSATDGSSVKEEHFGRGSSSKRETIGMGGGNDRGRSGTDGRVRVKDEPHSDGSDSDRFEGSESNRWHGRQVVDRELSERSRLGSSRYENEDVHCNVNGDRKRKWGEEENGSRRKYDDRYNRHSDYLQNGAANRAYPNSSRDTSSNKEYNNNKRNASLDRGYDKVRR